MHILQLKFPLNASLLTWISWWSYNWRFSDRFPTNTQYLHGITTDTWWTRQTNTAAAPATPLHSPSGLKNTPHLHPLAWTQNRTRTRTRGGLTRRHCATCTGVHNGHDVSQPLVQGWTCRDQGHRTKTRTLKPTHNGQHLKTLQTHATGFMIMERQGERWKDFTHSRCFLCFLGTKWKTTIT